MARTRKSGPWVGKNHDAPIPETVKRRVLLRQRNARGVPVCPLCTREIIPGEGVDYDHEKPLIDEGEHSEENLRAIHRKCHRLKTAREAHDRAKERSQFAAVYGIKTKKPFPKRMPYQPNVRQLYGDIEETTE
jgi:5-methylcytosine-specific restriction endonuclease McrA